MAGPSASLPCKAEERPFRSLHVRISDEAKDVSCELKEPHKELRCPATESQGWRRYYCRSALWERDPEAFIAQFGL